MSNKTVKLIKSELAQKFLSILYYEMSWKIMLEDLSKYSFKKNIAGIA